MPRPVFKGPRGKGFYRAIKSHLSKDFWNNITFFITKGEHLTKAHIKYLEGRLIEIAKKCERSKVVNAQASGAKLPESDLEDMEVFLAKMRQVLPVLDIDAFIEKPEIKRNNTSLLYSKIKDIVATGYLSPNGIIVLKNSQAVLEERPSAKKWPSTLAHRNQLIADGILIKTGKALKFIKDVEFSSPSAAAAAIHGGSANGLTAWTNKEGLTLKDLQEA